MPCWALIPREQRIRDRLSRRLIFFPLVATPTILVVSPLTLSLSASRAARQSPMADWQEVGMSTSVMGKKKTNHLVFKEIWLTWQRRLQLTLSLTSSLKQHCSKYVLCKFWVNNSVVHDLFDLFQLPFCLQNGGETILISDPWVSQ